MNLSSKTLTFAANQISGNAIDGGVISNFASTGIDDNSSATAVTILSDGKVGIGITSPIRQLHLASSVPSIRLEDTDVSGAYNDIVHLSTGELSIRVDHGNVQSNSSLSFLIDADEKMRIDSSGNIKFGPNGEGYINGAAQNTYNSGFNVNADDFSTWLNFSGYQGGTTKFRDLIIGNGKNGRVVTVDGSSGNVGIGTHNPTAKLHVEGTFQVRTSSNQTFNDSSNANNLTMTDSKAHFNLDGADKDFQISSDTVTHALFVQGSYGNVGIGADTPENSLHIKNNTATNGQMLIQGDANNTYIRMNKSGSTWAIGIDASDSNKFKIGNNSDLSAGTRLTVTGSGQVLINTTDPQDDPSMLRVLNSMSNLGGICLGKVHNSTNNNNAAVLLHKMGQGQGFQFSGKFIVNSWTGNRHIDCHITSYYTNDSVTVNTNSVNSGGVAATTVRLCTVNIGGVLYLAFVKNGGGSGVSYLNAFIEGNIHFSGGIQEVLTAGSGYTVTTTHHTF